MVLTKKEVEDVIASHDSFVKLDKLKRLLPLADSLDIKKFVLLKLAEVNESKNFLSEAAKHIEAAAEMSLTPKEKIELFMKEAEILVKGEHFEMSDKTFAKAAHCSQSIMEKARLQERYFGFYSSYGGLLESQGKHRKAIDIFQRLYTLPVMPEQKAKLKDKLLELYSKTGRMTDYNRLMNIPDYSSARKSSFEMKMR
ncbi:MAG: hypothetical protein WC796_04345 [Candidatus Pacearchaeota archaeon]|jgi:tetratricopeptide (TPR) repeat protein